MYPDRDNSLPPASSRQGGEAPTLLLALAWDAPALRRGVAAWAQRHGWELDFSLFCLGPAPACYDAVLMTHGSPEIFEWLCQQEKPVVRMLGQPENLAHPKATQWPAVELDNEQIGILGAKHLLSLGDPSFAFYLRGHWSDVLSLQRSFERTIAAVGKRITTFDFLADHPHIDPAASVPREMRRSWLQRKLAELPLPVAIMAEEERFALDLVYVAQRLGLRVPEDVAILSPIDQDLYLDSSPVPISAVNARYHEVGYAAAALAASLAQGGTAPVQPIRIAPTGIIARESTAVYVSQNPLLGKAMRFLWTHFREPLPVSRVAAHVGMTPRSLHRLFQAEGFTLHGEITRLRLDAAAQLLCSTDLKLDAVAMAVGLGDAKHLCRLFRQHHNATPQQIRAQAPSIMAPAAMR